MSGDEPVSTDMRFSPDRAIRRFAAATALAKSRIH
jgi:hypothetical protein